MHLTRRLSHTTGTALAESYYISVQADTLFFEIGWNYHLGLGAHAWPDIMVRALQPWPVNVYGCTHARRLTVCFVRLCALVGRFWALWIFHLESGYTRSFDSKAFW